MATKDERIHRAFQAIGVKGELAKTAKRLLRETPEYEAARESGCARDWLTEEAYSFAESAYSILLDRVEEFGGRR